MRELARRLTWARGAVLVAVLATVAVLALDAPGSAAPSPVSYSVTTAGAALQVVSTQRPAFSIATGDLVDQTLGLVDSSLGASTSEARAASYYPGDLVAQAGQLICGQFGPCPFDPPAYPLLAEASWPTVQHATAGHGVGTSSAAAGISSNEATTAVSSRPVGELAVGSITSSTSTAVRADGLHVRVVTALHDVALGPLAVSGVTVSDEVVVRPDGRRSAHPRVVVTGATVAGRAVELGAVPVPALAREGLAVRVVGASTAGARSGAVGVRVDVSVPVEGVGAPLPGLPSADRSYVGSFVLGQVSVVAARDDGFDMALPPLPVQPLPGAAPADPAVPPPPAALPVLPADVPAPLPTAPAGRVVARRTAGLDDLDLADLYAVLALGTVVGLAASRALSRRAWRSSAAWSWQGAVA